MVNMKEAIELMKTQAQAGENEGIKLRTQFLDQKIVYLDLESLQTD